MPNPITDRKIRLAVIGCGRIAKNHFGAIEQHRDRLELATAWLQKKIVELRADVQRDITLLQACIERTKVDQLTSISSLMRGQVAALAAPIKDLPPPG